MTYLEKLKEIHPEMTADELDEFIIGHCPHGNHGLGVEDVTCVDGDVAVACPKCWNREIPGTEPTVKPDPKTEQMMADFLENGLGVTQILDSGERRQFETGAVRDIQEGKGRCDLMPLDVVGEIYLHKTDRLGVPDVLFNIHIFTDTGNPDRLEQVLECFLLLDKPFGDANWSTMFLEMAIHFEEGAKKYGENNWQKGIPVRCYIDSAVRHYLKWLRNDTDEPHDRAFCWNILCAIWTCKHKPELNDYAPKQNDNTCVCCGTTIPEGYQVCQECFMRKENDHGNQ